MDPNPPESSPQDGAPSRAHVPVLLEESLRLLDPRPGETVLDCTAGLGGHARAFGERVGGSGVVVLNDLDPGNLERAAASVRALPDAPRVVTLHGGFADAPRRLAEEGLAADVVFADLGFASTHVDDAERGFSFQREGPLDMRYDPGAPVSAADLVNSLSVEELAQMLYEFGEERAGRRIAQKIADARAVEPITTTTRLADIVRAAQGFSPRRGGPAHARGAMKIDPATRTFQALRIAVNDELGSLRSLLEAVQRGASALAAGRAGSGVWLRPGARIGVIAFHSLEDRPVKQAFADLIARDLATPVSGVSARAAKPVTAGEDEAQRNPRARSSKFRVVRLR
ncbi:MAG: 16S rRNA (cytosine(1402)-N(4))-methyltransferase RsmH [Phycisphaerales bacterium]|nr:MAG: 16S rRNA (cytosine(1402)-N(4))-methyltransferase RsmH [Phycisphaerales bacterium]